MRTTRRGERRARRPDRPKLAAATGPGRRSCPARRASRRSTRPGRPFHDPEADEALFERHRRRRSPAPPGHGRSTPTSTSTTRRFAEAAARACPRRSPLAGIPSDARRCHSTRTEDPRSLPRQGRRRASRSSAAGPAPASRAKCAEAGGIDLIIIYNSGRFRMAGRGTLGGPDALRRRQRRSSWRWPREVLPVVERHAGPRRASAAPTRSGSWTGSSTECATRASPACRTSRPSACIDGDLPPEPGGDRHGLRQGGRDDRGWPASWTC